MTKNTFIVKSYQVFTNPLGPASIVVPSKNPFLNLLVINKLMAPWLVLGLFIPAVLILILGVMLRHVKDKRVVLVIASFLISLTLYAILLRFQMAFHYLFPLMVLIEVIIVYLISRWENKLKVGLLVILVLINLYKLPVYLYNKAFRDYQVIYKKLSTAVISLALPKEDFNIVIIRETPLAILGYEYRYMLRTLGYKADDEFSYNRSKDLLVVSENGEIDYKKIRSWELDQFRAKTLVRKNQIDGTVYYLFVKK